jgi:hypothetical protein
MSDKDVDETMRESLRRVLKRNEKVLVALAT